MTQVLRNGDGFSNQNPEFRDDVKNLQSLLVKAGYQMTIDGYFGNGTNDAVLDFQKKNSLVADGIVGLKTWDALNHNGQRPSAGTHELQGFRGDLSWVHAREGYAYKAYWPGGESGVTLDPGIDLGYADPNLVESLYSDILSGTQLSAVKSVYGIKGQAANSALSSNGELKSINISKSQSDAIFPVAARPYWQAISNRFKSLLNADTFSSVQTALLSLSYNRGAHNRGLEELKTPIDNKDWQKVADLIGAMQQDHALEGIRKRRRMEAQLIKDQLAKGGMA